MLSLCEGYVQNYIWCSFSNTARKLVTSDQSLFFAFMCAMNYVKQKLRVVKFQSCIHMSKLETCVVDVVENQSYWDIVERLCIAQGNIFSPR